MDKRSRLNLPTKFYFYSLLGLSFLYLQSCLGGFKYSDNQVGKKQQAERTAEYNQQLGLAYLARGNRIRAKEKLVLALDLAPNLPEVNTAMGFFLEKSGNLQEAETFYKKALALAPEDGTQLNNYGAYLCRTGHYREAESYFLKAVKDVRYLHSAKAYENAGLCAAEIPDKTKAVYYFKRALAEDPSRKQALLALKKIG